MYIIANISLLEALKTHNIMIVNGPYILLNVQIAHSWIMQEHGEGRVVKIERRRSLIHVKNWGSLKQTPSCDALMQVRKKCGWMRNKRSKTSAQRCLRRLAQRHGATTTDKNVRNDMNNFKNNHDWKYHYNNHHDHNNDDDDDDDDKLDHNRNL